MADAPAATRTRTRRAASAKAETTATETDTAAAKAAEKAAADAAAKAEKAAENEAKKAARDAEKAAEKEAKEKAKAEAKAEKEAERAKERQALIDSGDLIETEDENENVTTYTTSEPKKDAVAQRALEVIEVLKADGREVPVSGKELADRFGGGTVQWVSFFGMLRVLGLVKVYRFRTGERGGSGLSYLWIGD